MHLFQTPRRRVGPILIAMGLLGAACSDQPATVDAFITNDAAVDSVAVEDIQEIDSSDALAPDLADCPPVEASTKVDVPYNKIQGVNANLLSLDIYSPARTNSCESVPVIVWVHGGGWAAGDKGNGLDDKIKLFNDAGYVLVSINYRLSPNPANTSNLERVKFPIHPQDVAKALKEIADRIHAYGGDPSRIALLGHSAGAHLVSLVATDQSYLEAEGKSLGLIRCTASIDTAAYDLPTRLDGADAASTELYVNAFGSDEAVWTQASPITHVAAGKGISPILLVIRGAELRRTINAAFSKKLTDAQIEVTEVDGLQLSHGQVNSHIGKAGDTVITPPLMTFYTGCFE
jgi:arylformamidase